MANTEPGSAPQPAAGSLHEGGTRTWSATPAKGHSSPASYVVWTAIMIVLTIVAFVAVGYGLMPQSSLIAFILVLAAVQVFVQLAMFMHLNVSRSLYRAVFAVGIGFAIIFSYAIMWLTHSIGVF